MFFFFINILLNTDRQLKILFDKILPRLRVRTEYNQVKHTTQCNRNHVVHLKQTKLKDHCNVKL